MRRKRIALTLVAAAVVVVALAGYWIWWADRDNYLLRADARDLKSTVVTAHLEEPIVPGKNVLWCSTFQLAWNEACVLLGEDIHLDGEPPMVSSLNKKSATTADIDNASCVAMAGWAPGVFGAIRAEVGRKFGAEPGPLPEDVPPGSMVLYGCLRKSFEFPVPFERIAYWPGPGSKDVRGFGLSYRSSPEQREQVIVHVDPGNDPDGQLVIELKTKSPEDRLIIAKIAPEPTLAAVIDKVHALISKPKEHEGGASPYFTAPRLNFLIRRNYDELVGRKLAVTSPALRDQPISVAEQDIRFQMNERGVILKSEAKMAVPGSAPSPDDLRLLILLERRGAKAPYFALWVDNAELLVPAE